MHAVPEKGGLITSILESSVIAIIGGILTIPPISGPLEILSGLIALLTISIIYLTFYRKLKFKNLKKKSYYRTLLSGAFRFIELPVG